MSSPLTRTPRHLNASFQNFPVLGLLGLVFITLKLCGVIDWSWWWVTAPFWGGLAVFLLIALIGLGVLGVLAAAVGLASR